MKFLSRPKVPLIPPPRNPLRRQPVVRVDKLVYFGFQGLSVGGETLGEQSFD
ncbi:hypothetical protein [Salmonirosea aquatica]|uniref:hypothetical protein n=1 Tax=Salmonirosea aquatica TaxID=2654236 RepID=UPI003571466F